MNNEELVKSLRTEIQTYLKNTVADLQQEIAGMHERMTAEIERHRNDLDKSFQELLSRGSAVTVDDAFTGVVSEHLKIAYEDGANETEAKFAEKEPEQKDPDYLSLRDAISEISEQGSQADILKALVKHASAFAPRGAFFVVKSEHLVGWRVYGEEAKGGDESVREIFLSINGDTLLGTSIKENATQRALSGNANDAQYLKRLNFGEPRQMVAVPLVVRERGVAVLYADSGESGSAIQVEALETLVRVAGLTVELLASAKSPAPRQAKPQPKPQPVKTVTEAPVRDFSFATPAPSQSGVAFDFQTPSVPVQPNNYEVSYDEPASYSAPAPKPSEPDFTPTAELNEVEPSQQDIVVEAQPFSDFQQYAAPPQPQPQPEATFSFDTAPMDVAVQPMPVEPVAQEPAPKPKDRSLELPVEVPEDERRLHNDARRFARLLVSEIKLYNEQKVKEGRQVGDLYNRLREAVDRSREMYEKRVAPPVASKFDYFHYELVNTLAEGDENKLGGDYPGATV